MDSSTIDQTVTLEIAKSAGQLKAEYIDAPISGGVTGENSIFQQKLHFSAKIEEKNLKKIVNKNFQKKKIYFNFFF